MPDERQAAVNELGPAQAADLSLLVELEARWENMRNVRTQAQDLGPTHTLLGVQKAYDAYRSKLAAYNKRHTPAHVPELLLNTPSRLAAWCRTMRELYLQVEHTPQTAYPLQLLEKAHRRAERMSVRAGRDRVERPTTPATVRAAIDYLGALAEWCDLLVSNAVLPATPETTAVPAGVATHHAHVE